jgi:hypothetical protein
MIRHRFYVGTEQKTGVPVSKKAWDKINALLVHRCGGYTVFDACGAWRNDEGQVIDEESVCYEVLADAAVLTDVAVRIRTVANQASVLYTHEAVMGEFV